MKKDPKISVRGGTTNFVLLHNQTQSRNKVLGGQQMPGQCGILILYEFVGKDEDTITDLLTEARQIAEADGYPWLMASTVAQQTAANRALAAAGWEQFWSFTNCRTDNTVHMWRLALPNATAHIHYTA